MNDHSFFGTGLSFEGTWIAVGGAVAVLVLWLQWKLLQSPAVGRGKRAGEQVTHPAPEILIPGNPAEREGQ